MPVRPPQNQRDDDSEDQRERQQHIKLDPQRFDLALELADAVSVDPSAAAEALEDLRVFTSAELLSRVEEQL